MSLRDEAHELRPKKKGPRNQIEVAMEDNPSLAKELFELLNDLTISAGTASATCQRHGINIGRGTVERYRRNEYVTLPFPYTLDA